MECFSDESTSEVELKNKNGSRDSPEDPFFGLMSELSANSTKNENTKTSETNENENKIHEEDDSDQEDIFKDEIYSSLKNFHLYCQELHKKQNEIDFTQYKCIRELPRFSFSKVSDFIIEIEDRYCDFRTDINLVTSRITKTDIVCDDEFFILRNSEGFSKLNNFSFLQSSFLGENEILDNVIFFDVSEKFLLFKRIEHGERKLVILSKERLFSFSDNGGEAFIDDDYVYIYKNREVHLLSTSDFQTEFVIENAEGLFKSEDVCIVTKDRIILNGAYEVHVSDVFYCATCGDTLYVIDNNYNVSIIGLHEAKMMIEINKIATNAVEEINKFEKNIDKVNDDIIEMKKYKAFDKAFPAYKALQLFHSNKEDDAFKEIANVNDQSFVKFASRDRKLASALNDEKLTEETVISLVPKFSAFIENAPEENIPIVLNALLLIQPSSKQKLDKSIIIKLLDEVVGLHEVIAVKSPCFKDLRLLIHVLISLQNK